MIVNAICKTIYETIFEDYLMADFASDNQELANALNDCRAKFDNNTTKMCAALGCSTTYLYESLKQGSISLTIALKICKIFPNYDWESFNPKQAEKVNGIENHI